MRSEVRPALRYLTGAFFVGAGLMHFLKPGPYVKIMPPFIPAPLEMVYVSGAAEIAGGMGLCIPATRRAAMWGLLALLVAVFPANVYMAMGRVQVTAWAVPGVLLWARLPLQGVLMWWVWRVGGETQSDQSLS